MFVVVEIVCRFAHDGFGHRVIVVIRVRRFSSTLEVSSAGVSGPGSEG